MVSKIMETEHYNNFRYRIHKNYSLYNSRFSGYKSHSVVTDTGCKCGRRRVQKRNGTDDEKSVDSKDIPKSVAVRAV